MRTAAWLPLVVLTQTLGCASAPPAPRSGSGSAPASLSAEAARRVSKGVFEVVIPKVEDDTVQFKEPLPVDLLPFAQRSDKFIGIGTAFAISPTRFVTAAHVIPAHAATTRDRYLLRDPAGATYEIGQITKYSQYRDVVEFELVKAPANVVPLELRKTVDVGEPVFTVGNARAEGVVLRGGTVTSRTPEPLDGKWNFLRFTAPASPGNSGGPLVDSAGRVLGVVVRKTEAENYNFAVPIDQLEKLSATQSEFWIKGLALREDNQQMLVNWQFASPLPASLGALREASRHALHDSLTKWLADFDTKFAKETFPGHPNLQAYLREPVVPFGLGRFTIDGNGKWETARTTYVDKEIAAGQKAHFFEAADKKGGEILLDRPRDVSLAAFFETPKALADAIVHNYSWGITFAGKRIAIETLGEPAEKERWVDDYGRPWFTYVWRLKRTDESLIFDCLTNPAGWACRWKKIGVPLEEGARMDAPRTARRTTLSYYGRVSDWVEFLALPETYRPQILAKASVRFDKSSLTFDLGPFSGNVSVPLLSDTSEVSAFATLDPSSLKRLHVFDVRVVPRKDKSYSFGVEEVLEPVERTSEKHAQFWKNLQASAPPYDNAVVFDGKRNVIRHAAKAAKADAGKLHMFYCRSGSEDSKPELQAACAKFQSSVKIAHVD